MTALNTVKTGGYTSITSILQTHPGGFVLTLCHPHRQMGESNIKKSTGHFYVISMRKKRWEQQQSNIFHPINEERRSMEMPRRKICWSVVIRKTSSKLDQFGANHHCLVVWLPFFIFPYIGNNHPNWLSYFSEGWPNHQPDQVDQAQQPLAEVSLEPAATDLGRFNYHSRKSVVGGELPTFIVFVA